jgi:hypothetical protein
MDRRALALRISGHEKDLMPLLGPRVGDAR